MNCQSVDELFNTMMSCQHVDEPKLTIRVQSCASVQYDQIVIGGDA